MRPRRRRRRSEPIHRRLYRGLLRAYPRDFRQLYGDEAVAVFAALYRDARARGRLPALRLILVSLLRVPRDGCVERLSRRIGPRLKRGPGQQRDGATRGDSMDRLVADLRYALRSLRRAPGFAATAVLTVGLGLGATATIFSVVDAVLLRPLPYPDSDRMVRVLKGNSAVPIPDYLDWRDGTMSFDTWAAAWDVSVDLTGAGDPERLEAATVTRHLLPLLGAPLATGRLLTESDFDPGAPRVAVISHALWRRRWASDPGLIGATISLSGEPVEVVGVLGREFRGPEALELDDVEIFIPLDRAAPEYRARNYYILAVVARLAPGAALASARAELATLEAALAEAHPDHYKPREDGEPIIRATPLKAATVGDTGTTLYMFLGAVGFMLVIACANIANLLLARGTVREREMAVRRALGAGRRRIVRQLLTESLLMSLLGGALGTGMALLGVEVFRMVNPGGIPRLAEVSVDLRVLGFALGLATLTGVAFGIFPALSSSRADGGGVLREAGGRSTAGATRSRMRSALVVVEVSLALVLLAGAGLLFNSFVRLRHVETGFRPERVLTAQLHLDAAYEGQDRVRFTETLLQRLGSVPGVKAVGASWRLPFDRGRCCWRSSAWADAGRDTIGPYIHPVTAGYFESLGIGLLEGRTFSRSDRWSEGLLWHSEPEQLAGLERPIPVIINRGMAQRIWPDRSALDESLHLVSFRGAEARVVGVVNDVRHWSLDSELDAHVYVPFTAFAAEIGLLDVAVRHEMPRGELTDRIRESVAALNANLPLGRIATMEARIARSIATPRFYTILLTTFAAIAFLLAAAGIYGSMLYTVEQRQQEMGIRIALGARPDHVVRMVLGHGMLLAGLGTILGVSVALVASRALESLLFGIGAQDLTTFFAAAAGLFLIATAACYVPARRAARTDPVETLRRT